LQSKLTVKRYVFVAIIEEDAKHLRAFFVANGHKITGPVIWLLPILIISRRAAKKSQKLKEIF